MCQIGESWIFEISLSSRELGRFVESSSGSRLDFLESRICLDVSGKSLVHTNDNRVEVVIGHTRQIPIAKPDSQS